MSCERFEWDRLLYACEDLTNPTDRLRRHLAECPECAAEVRGIKEVRALYRSGPAMRPMRAQRVPFGGLATVAAALMVAVTGWFLVPPARPPAPVPVTTSMVDDGLSIDGQIAWLRERLDALRVPDDAF